MTMTPHEQLKEALYVGKRNTSSLTQEYRELHKALALLETHTLVPNEPTAEMCDAVDKVERWNDGSFKFGCRPAYKAIVKKARE